MANKQERWSKVKAIFNSFDANKDGCLNRNELANMVVTLDHTSLYGNAQILAAIDECFTLYSAFVKGEKGLTYIGLTCLYDDGIRDVDRDFNSLGLQNSIFPTIGVSAMPGNNEKTTDPQSKPSREETRKKFSEMAWQAIGSSVKIAKCKLAETEYLMKSLLEQRNGLARQIFLKAGLDNSRLLDATNKFIERNEKLVKQSACSDVGPQYENLLLRSLYYMEELEDSVVSVEHFVLAFGLDDRFGKQLFKDFRVSLQTLVQIIETMRENQRVVEEELEENGEALKKYGKDLTAMAREGKLDPVIGRDDEIQRCIQILSRKTKNNPILIGEPGVGKTAISEGFESQLQKIDACTMESGCQPLVMGLGNRLAQKIVQGDVPQALLDQKLISLDVGGLLAGAKYVGDFQDRLKDVIKEIKESDRHIILFIDEIHTVVGAGSTESCAMDVSNLLKPMLGRGELRCIGATTFDEYRKYIAKDPALERRFQQVTVDQPTIEDTISLLRGMRQRYELHHGVCIADSALVEAAILSERYISGRFLPDKAIDLVDEAAAKLRMEVTSKPMALDEINAATLKLEMEKLSLTNNTDIASKNRLNRLQTELSLLKQRQAELNEQWEHQQEVMRHFQSIKEEIDRVNFEIQQFTREGDLNRAAGLKSGSLSSLENQLLAAEKELDECIRSGASKTREVTGSDIAEVVSKWTGIPVSKLQETERDKLLLLGEELHKRVVGQDPAVMAVAQAIQRSRVGLSDPCRPIASFMFMGPTGVGKTELAKALASYLLNTKEALIRIDMSEYMDKYSVTRLIGAPPGYVGHDDGGQLTESVRKRPYAVVLFDEIEKAHTDVFNIFLQILDDGRLTDSQGHTVNFTNTVIIMTSNIGSEHILSADDNTLSQDKAYESIKQKVMDAARSTFRPEFINRIDECIVFKPLSRDQIIIIVRLQLERVQKRLADRNMKLEVSDAAVKLLGNLGYDPKYGARPVKRVIQKNVENELAKGILRGDFTDYDTVLVDVELCPPVHPQFSRQRLVFRKLQSGSIHTGSGPNGMKSVPGLKTNGVESMNQEKPGPESRMKRRDVLKKLLGNNWERFEYVGENRS